MLRDIPSFKTARARGLRGRGRMPGTLDGAHAVTTPYGFLKAEDPLHMEGTSVAIEIG